MKEIITMQANNYIRLALMFCDNNATTFRQNLEKMIKLVLSEQCESGLCVDEIIECLRDKYMLEFSTSDVLDILNGRRSNFVCLNSSTDIAHRRFSITPEDHKKIESKIAESSASSVIHNFLAKHEDISLSEEEFQELLFQYFYAVFNSNAHSILQLINSNSAADDFEQIDFDTKDKEIINSFIFWDNQDKDRFVYNMVSCCFDYCMMTVKKDTQVYKTIFSKKCFYLDSNIIFRLMGLNQEGRRKIILAFIKKCKDVGISIRFTNHTRKEVYDTITYHVQQIKKLLGGQHPITVSALEKMDPYANLDFYSAYCKWCDNKANVAGDYESFKNYLTRTANNTFENFQQDNFDDYKDTRTEEFQFNVDSLTDYKSKKHRYVYESNIKVDINNYLYVTNKNSQAKSQDFFSVHNYIISADHAYGDWAKEKRPGTTPAIVLPSVWYSIILRYAGRTTSDDITAFTRFLNYSMSNTDGRDNKRLEILQYVLHSLDESAEIKSRTIEDIDRRLQTEYIDIDSVEEIVETSHQYILDEEIQKIKKKEQELKTQEIRAVTQKYENRIYNIKQQADMETKTIRAEMAKQSLEHTAREKELKDNKRNDEVAAENRVKQELLNTLVKKKHRQYLCTAVLIYILFIATLVVLVSWLCMQKESLLPEQNSGLIIAGIMFIGGAVEAGIIRAVYTLGLCGLDEDKIRARIERSLLT